MTSHELARALLTAPNQPVLSWCPDGEDWFPVTGFTSSNGDGVVKLYNDSDEEYNDE